MPTSSSSNDGEGKRELNSPGQRTGEGAGSVLPYLHDSLASRPGELFPADQYGERKPPKSLAERVRRALQIIRMAKSGPREPR